MSSLAAIAKHEGLLDGSAATRDLALDAEVCVIGSGAGGAVAAATLAEHGKDVLVVEEGPFVTNADFTMREEEMYPRLYQDSMRRATEDLGISILQGRTVGGTTVVNWTTCFRTPPDVVQHWHDKHAVGGFRYADLVPGYEWIERRLNISVVDTNVINPNNRKLKEACEKLGWSWAPLNRNVYACMHSGYCGVGCPYNAKRSMAVTLLPDAIEAGARVLYRARIDRLVEAGGEIVRAEGTLLRGLGHETTGKKVSITAKRFVASGGAINTPGLLLRSGINDSDRVGLRTFLHPALVGIGDYPEKIEAYYGAPQSIASHHFGHRGDEVGFFLEAAPIHPVLASAIMPSFGAQHRTEFARLPHVAGHIAIAVDGFHDDVPGGRVRVRDSGAPLLDYPIPERLWRTFAFAQARLAELQLGTGALRSVTTHEPPHVSRTEADIAKIPHLPWRTGSVGVFSAHQMGGCAMGDDPKRSVVRSEDLRHHRLENLYVIDGSVFPTSLGVNPQESIYGLARLMSTRMTAS
jgi:choline dehydrogenase-like flavoprotein